MGDNLEQTIDILEIASSLIGKTTSVKFNSKIYDHSMSENEKLDPSKDIFIVQASVEKPITLESLICVFKKMQKQFRLIEKYESDRSYYYEGMSFYPESSECIIIWGS